jgi:hypothetical protein
MSLIIESSVFGLRILGNREIWHATKVGILLVERPEGRTTQRRMKTRIIPEFRETKPFFPLLWIILDCATQILLKALVDTFALTIGLGMICSCVIQTSAQGFKQLLPKMTGEDAIPIGNNG